MGEKDDAVVSGDVCTDKEPGPRLDAQLRLDHDTKGEPRIPFQFYDEITVEEAGEMSSFRVQDLGGIPLKRGQLDPTQIAEIGARLEAWESAGFPAPAVAPHTRLRLHYKLQNPQWQEGAVLPPELEAVVDWLNTTIQTMPSDPNPFP